MSSKTGYTGFVETILSILFVYFNHSSIHFCEADNTLWFGLMELGGGVFSKWQL